MVPMLTEPEAIKIAREFLAKTFQHVPEVAMTLHLTKEAWHRLEGIAPYFSIEKAISAYCEKWLIAFRCSWETDLQGLPRSVVVIVDEADSSAQMLYDGAPK